MTLIITDGLLITWLQVAMSAAQQLDDPAVWEKLSQIALQQGNHQVRNKNNQQISEKRRPLFRLDQTLYFPSA